MPVREYGECPALFASARTTQGVASIPGILFVLIAFAAIALCPQGELAIPDRKKHGAIALLFAVALPVSYVVVTVNYISCQPVCAYANCQPDPACLACLGWWHTPIFIGFRPIAFVFNGLLLGGTIGAAYIAWTCLCCIKCLQCKNSPKPRVMWATVPLCVLVTFLFGYLGCAFIFVRVAVAARQQRADAASVAVVAGVPFSEAASTSLMANQAPGLSIHSEPPTVAHSCPAPPETQA